MSTNSVPDLCSLAVAPASAQTCPFVGAWRLARVSTAFAVVFSSLPLAHGVEVTGEEMRDEVIAMVNNDEWSDQTCRRVGSLGKGVVSDAECVSRVESANTRCLNLAKEHVPVVVTEDQGKFLIDILTACPIAEVLGIEHAVKDGRVFVEWDQLDAPASKR